MPRYFFNLFNDETTIDEEGLELPDDESAKARARDEARNFAAESIRHHGHLVLHHHIEVIRNDGVSVGVIGFGDVVEIRQ